MHFIDTIKMIACRAGIAPATRTLLRRVFVTPASLRPDYEQKTLLVERHRLGSPLQDLAVVAEGHFSRE